MAIRLAILASGNGSNFQAIVDAVESGELKARIVQLISDKPQCFALQRAQKHGIPFSSHERKVFPTKEAFDRAILEDLIASGAEWVALAGYMRLVPPLLLQAFPNKILNIHPSLLPLFPGLNAIEQAWKAGAKKTGCTVHFVDEGCDTGPIIAQSAFDILPEDNLDSVTQRMHEHEHRLYVEVLKAISEGRVSVQGRSVTLA